MNRFALGIVTGCLGLLGLVAASYGLLAVARPESLPAPPITRFAALDEKLRFLRRNPDYDPAIVAIGSSVAWRQLDGAAFDAATGREHAFLNAATVHLQVHQSRAMLDFYLAQYRNVRHVLLMTGLPDFGNCSSEPETLMMESAAADYAFDGWPSAWFYMRFFAPQRFAQSALTLAERRQPLTGDLWLDRWGSGPLDVPAEMLRGLRYGGMQADPACLQALLDLAQDMRRRGIAFTVVIPPVHPHYRQRYPEAMAALCRIAARLEPLTAAGTFQLILRQDDPRYRAEDFFDAFHLQYPAVRRLSEDIARSLHGLSPADALIASSRRPGLRDVPPRRERPARNQPQGCEQMI